MTLSIVLADDHTIVRDGLRALLEMQPDMRVVGVAATGRAAVQLVQQHQPSLILLDIAMPELNGIEAARQIADLYPETQIVMLSMHSTSEHVYQALQAGARGYLMKESAGAEVVAAVRAVCAGQRYLSQKIADTVVDEYIRHRQATSPLESLSAREREILQLIVEGQSSAAVGAALALSPKTVETYRTRLMHKLGVSDLPALVKFAVQHGLTPVQ